MTEDKAQIEKSTKKNISTFLHDYLSESGYTPSASNVGKKKTESSSTDYEKAIRWSHPSVLKLVQDHPHSDDPAEIVREKSRNMVLEAFTRGWVGPPFDVIKLAKMNGYEVRPNEVVAEARIIPDKKSFIIEYNPFQSQARINFSVAHEIAHTLFSDCGETIRYRKNALESGSWQLEFLCNIAASELLLPYAEFTNIANDVDLKIDSLINLARKYQSSVESVFLRFSQVVEKPCTIAICSFHTDGALVVDYSKDSMNSNLRIPKAYIIPKNSNVHDCVKAGYTSYGIETWDIFKETRHAVYGVGLSPVKKQVIARVGLLIVPEHYNSKPEKGIRIVYGDATSPRGNGNQVIAQVINTSGGLGFGFGRAMAQKYPQTRKAVVSWKKDKKRFHLGENQIVGINDSLNVFQMLSQNGIYPRYGEIPLKYAKLRIGLIALRNYALTTKSSVHMPAIGAGQAGGDWNIIKGMIYDELVACDVEVTIYLLPSKNAQPNESRTLTLFKNNDEE